MQHESLAAALRVLRAQRGLGLVEASEGMGISRQTLSRLENGIGTPYYPSLAKISRFYNVPISNLTAYLDEDETLEPAEVAAPRAEALTWPAPAVSGYERRVKDIMEYESYEEPFGELRARERFTRLRGWLEHFNRLGARRSLDLENMREDKVVAYGRWLEMYALDRVEWERYVREGIHTYTERVLRGDVEASEEERELCRRVAWDAVRPALRMLGGERPPRESMCGPAPGNVLLPVAVFAALQR